MKGQVRYDIWYAESRYDNAGVGSELQAGEYIVGGIVPSGR